MGIIYGFKLEMQISLKDFMEIFDDIILMVGFGENKVCYSSIEELEINLDDFLAQFLNNHEIDDFQVPEEYYTPISDEEDDD